MEKNDIVKLLREDVAEFNRLRREDPAFGPGLDLSEAQLAEASLASASLGRVNLRGADLRGADLGGAALGSAILEGADLRDVNLAGASLHESRLNGANLRGADVERFSGKCRICMHATNFQGVHWDRDQIEAMLQVINENPDWVVRYEIAPK